MKFVVLRKLKSEKEKLLYFKNFHTKVLASLVEEEIKLVKSCFEKDDGLEIIEEIGSRIAPFPHLPANPHDLFQLIFGETRKILIAYSIFFHFWGM